jgi:AcrR family transcriptional regulator
MKMKPEPKRRQYRQVARAKAAAETARKVIDAFTVCAGERWFDDITLQEVATRAGVTVRSVIRRFGSKEGLVKAMVEDFGPDFDARFVSIPGDIDAAVGRLFAVYEHLGDGAIRNLAQEHRVPALQPLIDHGRASHRSITAEQFAPWLDRLAGKAQRDLLDALVIVTDIYVWKLLRRDMGRSVKDAKAAVKRLIEGALAAHGPNLDA